MEPSAGQLGLVLSLRCGLPGGEALGGDSPRHVYVPVCVWGGAGLGRWTGCTEAGDQRGLVSAKGLEGSQESSKVEEGLQGSGLTRTEISGGPSGRSPMQERFKAERQVVTAVGPWGPAGAGGFSASLQHPTSCCRHRALLSFSL